MRFDTAILGFWLLTACGAGAAQSPVTASQEHGPQGHSRHDHAADIGKGHSQPGQGMSAGGSRDQHGRHAEHETSCPMKVAGTTLSVSDIEGGAALDFQTTGDVAELRRRVTEMASKHAEMKCPMHAESEGSAMGAAAAPVGTNGPDSARMSSEHELMHAAKVSAEPTEKGARLTFSSPDAAQVDALRVILRKKAEKMKSGSCAMHTAQPGHAAAADTGG